MNIINAKAFLKAVDDVNCGRANIVQLNSADFEIKQETTNPLDGYEPPEGFPNCCNYHKTILQIGIERFKNFPNCCESHKKLNTVSWFKKSNYSYLPHKLVTTLNYTIHCISSCIDKPSWYKDITDYIEYTKSSYGQFPDGFGSPLGSELYLYNLEKKIESLNEIADDKKGKLLTFIKKYYEPEITVEQTDFNLLIGKYKEWLKIFPFELSFFRT